MIWSPGAQIKKSVAAGGEQKAAVAPVKATGLDAMLAAIQGAKKVMMRLNYSVLEPN